MNPQLKIVPENVSFVPACRKIYNFKLFREIKMTRLKIYELDLRIHGYEREKDEVNVALNICMICKGVRAYLYNPN